MLGRVSLGTAVAVAAWGCGSAFSAQDDQKDASPAEASIGIEGPGDAPAAPSDGASQLDATTALPGQLDGAKDQAAEAAAPCAGTGGPPGVRVCTYCIDSTEVTNRQYAAFLANQEA